MRDSVKISTQTDSEAPPVSLKQRYRCGLTLSTLLTMWLAGLDLTVLLFVLASGPQAGYFYFLLLQAGLIFISVPLAIALLVTWIVYMAVRASGDEPVLGRLHTLMFLPALLAFLVIPINIKIASLA